MIGFAIETTARATIILGLAFTASRFWRHRSSAERHAVWAAALLMLLVLPSLHLVLPTLELPVLASADAPPNESPEPATTLAGINLSVEPGSESLTVGQLAERHNPTPYMWVILACWLLGAMLGSSVLIIGYASLLWISTHCTDLSSDPSWSQALAEAGKLFPGADRVRLVTHPKVDSPMTWGWWKPVIAMPPAARGWTLAERRSALNHELAHVERRDWTVHMLVSWARAVYWFHPLVWLAARRVSLESEKAADDRVLEAGAQRADYAEQLVELARSYRQNFNRAPAAVAMAKTGELQYRIAAILDPQTRRHPMKHTHLAALFCSALILLTAVASTRLVHAEPRSGYSATIAPARLTTDDEQRLFVAAARGNSMEAQRLIDGGADPNAWIRGDGTALIAAARGGHQDTIEMLLAAGAQPDLGAAGDGNALIAAADRGNAGMLRTLLDAGADPDAAVKGDGNALIAAARSNHADLLNLLLDAGADIDKVVPGDENALIQAAWAGHKDAVQLLIDRGADVNKTVIERSLRITEKRSPLKMARRGGHTEVAELLIRHGAVEP